MVGRVDLLLKLKSMRSIADAALKARDASLLRRMMAWTGFSYGKCGVVGL